MIKSGILDPRYMEFQIPHLLLLLLTFGSIYEHADGARRSEHIPKSSIVKSMKADNGDIFYCYPIEKQPAFDHPLLKDHIIHAKPTYYLQRKSNQTLQKTSSPIQLFEVKCPEGTVPIQRTEEKDVGKFPSLPQPKPYGFDGCISPNAESEYVNYIASRSTFMEKYYGGKATLSVHAIEGILPTQSSGASIYVVDNNPSYDNDMIVVGWLVRNELYKNYDPRLTVYFLVTGKGGCFNTNCPGYVQVHRSKAPGMAFHVPPSGEYIETTLEISYDEDSHAWWLHLGDGSNSEALGYWPGSLFTTLSESCAQVQMGGVTISPRDVPSPRMGTGRSPKDAFGRIAYIRDIWIKNKVKMVDPAQFFLLYDRSSAPTYDISRLFTGEGRGLRFYYGGRGNITK